MSRKYRQRGYRDDEVEHGDREGRQRSRRASEGPRGRGLGAPETSFVKCARCGVTVVQAIMEDSTCRQCGSDLHTCTNCRHFDSAARNECRVEVPERIRSKAKRNSCDLFSRRVVQESRSDTASEAKSARSAFDALFD